MVYVHCISYSIFICSYFCAEGNPRLTQELASERTIRIDSWEEVQKNTRNVWLLDLWRDFGKERWCNRLFTIVLSLALNKHPYLLFSHHKSLHKPNMQIQPRRNQVFVLQSCSLYTLQISSPWKPPATKRLSLTAMVLIWTLDTVWSKDPGYFWKSISS